MKEIEIPVWEKLTLSVAEAAAYSNIGTNKIYSMMKDPNCKFVVNVGKRKLIKRKEFEQYIANRVFV